MLGGSSSEAKLGRPHVQLCPSGGHTAQMGPAPDGERPGTSSAVPGRTGTWRPGCLVLKRIRACCPRRQDSFLQLFQRLLCGRERTYVGLVPGSTTRNGFFKIQFWIRIWRLFLITSAGHTCHELPHDAVRLLSWGDLQQWRQHQGRYKMWGLYRPGRCSHFLLEPAALKSTPPHHRPR